MMASLPPEAISPLGNLSDGGSDVRELMWCGDCTITELSNVKGRCSETRFHCRTVQSREAEKMVFEDGNTTARTLQELDNLSWHQGRDGEHLLCGP